MIPAAWLQEGFNRKRVWRVMRSVLEVKRVLKSTDGYRTLNRKNPKHGIGVVPCARTLTRTPIYYRGLNN